MDIYQEVAVVYSEESPAIDVTDGDAIVADFTAWLADKPACRDLIKTSDGFTQIDLSPLGSAFVTRYWMKRKYTPEELEKMPVGRLPVSHADRMRIMGMVRDRLLAN